MRRVLKFKKIICTGTIEFWKKKWSTRSNFVLTKIENKKVERERELLPVFPAGEHLHMLDNKEKRKQSIESQVQRTAAH